MHQGHIWLFTAVIYFYMHIYGSIYESHTSVSVIKWHTIRTKHTRCMYIRSHLHKLLHIFMVYLCHSAPFHHDLGIFLSWMSITSFLPYPSRFFLTSMLGSCWWGTIILNLSKGFSIINNPIKYCPFPMWAATRALIKSLDINWRVQPIKLWSI
jgi:hypothetical protein